MDELVRWLGACLDEDERIAQAAARQRGGANWKAERDAGEILEVVGEQPRPGAPIPVVLQPDDDETTVFIAEWDPARVLREIEAKRLLVKAWASMLDIGPDVEGGYIKPCRAALAEQARNFLIVLSLPFADRTGYAEAMASVD